MKIWIVTGRIDGTELMWPKVFYSEKEAYDCANGYIADLVRDDIDEDENININDDEAVVLWGEENGYCEGLSYIGSSDWTELQVTEHEITVS